jgi:hypothetical protein
MWAGHIWDWMHHIGLDTVVARAVRVAAVWSHMRVLGGGFPLQHDAVSAHKYGAVKFVAAGITGRDRAGWPAGGVAGELQDGDLGGLGGAGEGAEEALIPGHCRVAVMQVTSS